MNKKNATSLEKKAALKLIGSQYKGISAAKQCARLLVALAGWSINTFEAMRYLDVYHCPARILQLRKQGYKITTHWQTVITEAGERHRVGLYVLESGAKP
jgi:Helix-turn-helix domain